MKKKIFYFLVCLLVVTTGCKKDKEPELPPITSNGDNTFGCTINGELFIPKTPAYTDPPYPRTTASYGPTVFYIAGYRIDKSNGKNDNINLSLPAGIESGRTYTLNGDAKLFGIYWNYYLPDTTRAFSTDSTFVGEISIFKLDTVKQIVSGTFWFDARNKNNSIVKVRDGRFDLQYIK